VGLAAGTLRASPKARPQQAPLAGSSRVQENSDPNIASKVLNETAAIFVS
jgi:hypothetical protein